MTLTAVLFDWDNTLVHSWHTIHAAYNATFADFSMPTVSLPEVQRLARQSARTSFPTLFGAQRSDEAIEIYRAHYQKIAGKPTPIKGSKELLQYLQRRSILIGVISNKSHDFLTKEITALDWGQYFSLGWLGAGRAEKDKPSPLALQQFAALASGRTLPDKAWPVQPSNILYYVGDNAIDITFAHNCHKVMHNAEQGNVHSILIGNDIQPGDPKPDQNYADLDCFTQSLHHQKTR